MSDWRKEDAEWLRACGNPAFPHKQFPSNNWGAEFTGMSLRDWFAGQALAGLVAQNTVGGIAFTEVTAKQAYDYANEMLRARTRPQEGEEKP